MRKLKKIFACFLSFALLLLINVQVDADELSGDFSVAANAAIAIDADTGKILYNQNADDILGIASITKIISLYLVEQEIANNQLDWNDEVTISPEIAQLSVSPELSNVPLEANNTYTVKELFDSAVIQSANSSIMALAEKIAGSETEFVELMREQLQKWGISEAKIVNSSGLPNIYLGENRPLGSELEDENMLSAKDVAIVARHLIKDFPDILEVSSTAVKEFGTGIYGPVVMTSSNLMLPGQPYGKIGVDGLKTGTTDLAGACFVGTMSKDDQRIITVVLNATNHVIDPGARFIETGRLMDYVFDNWEYKEVLATHTQIPAIKTIPVRDGKELEVAVSGQAPINMWIHSSMLDKELTFETELDENRATDNELLAPIEEDEVVGIAQAKPLDTLGFVTSEDEKTIQSPLITNQQIKKANLIVRMW